jgi:hypothetical protein
MAITRTAMVDDDGTGTTGTIINNAWKTELYNQIDAADASLAVTSGAFTPLDLSGAGLTYASAGGSYVAIGSFVSVAIEIIWPSSANSAQATCSLPFVAGHFATAPFFSAVAGHTNYSKAIGGLIAPGTPDRIALYEQFGAAVATVTNAQLSGLVVRMTINYQRA